MWIDQWSITGPYLGHVMWVCQWWSIFEVEIAYIKVVDKKDEGGLGIRKLK